MITFSPCRTSKRSLDLPTNTADTGTSDRGQRPGSRDAETRDPRTSLCAVDQRDATSGHPDEVLLAKAMMFLDRATAVCTWQDLTVVVFQPQVSRFPQPMSTLAFPLSSPSSTNYRVAITSDMMPLIGFACSGASRQIDKYIIRERVCCAY